jgi:4'-phosphopantetheinyl transferase
VKAIGKGLVQPLDSFAFTLDPLSIQFDNGLAGASNLLLSTG